MKRKSYQRLRAVAAQSRLPAPPPVSVDGTVLGHHVYVVLLDPKALGRKRKVSLPRPSPSPIPVYVGLTGLDPETRFANHKAGIKAARVVKNYGLRLLPELFAHLNPMPYETAVIMERELAQDLKAQGYRVFGGH